MLGLLKKKNKKKEDCQIVGFFTSRRMCKLLYYSDVIHYFDWKSAVEHDDRVFKMRDSVPSAGYFRVCNVLRLWKIYLIPAYRFYDNILMKLCYGLSCSLKAVQWTSTQYTCKR